MAVAANERYTAGSTSKSRSSHTDCHDRESVIVELPVLPVIERYTGGSLSKSMASLNRSCRKMGGAAAPIASYCARSEATQATCDWKSSS
eukprot:scaffold87894_cov75-Phaeocystis_antarctica.AAC.2